MNKTAKTFILSSNSHNKIKHKKNFYSTKRINIYDSTKKQNKNIFKDSSCFNNKNKSHYSKINSNLKNSAKNITNDKMIIKFDLNLNKEGPKNKLNESNILNNSNFSSINNSLTSSSNFDFTNNNKMNKENIEKLAEDLNSDRDSNL